MLKKPALPAGILSGMKLSILMSSRIRGIFWLWYLTVLPTATEMIRAVCGRGKRLLEMGSRDPETVAELIVNKAAEKYGIRERDDLTVMVAAL